MYIPNPKKYNPYLPNIRYTSQNEIHNNNINNEKYQFYEDLYDDEDNNDNNNINDQLTGRNIEETNKKLLNTKKEKVYNHPKSKIFPNINQQNENIILKKNNSQLDMINNRLHINSYENSNDSELSNFVGKIKILNFYSSSEIILLIENIISELNLKKDYSFSVRDSYISFIFNDAEQALSIFKQINIEKLKNKYYQNLIIDIKFEIKKNKNEEIKETINEINNDINDKKKEKSKKIKAKKLFLLSKDKSRNFNELENKKLRKFKNIRTYNFSKDNMHINKISDKNFAEIYNNYNEYFKHRKEERRKRELNYHNGKDISLLASTPFVENNNKKSFQQKLRKYNGNDISPSKFNGFIDKASIKKDNYNENHLYEVPDFINHWKLREENKSKWICPAKFQV